MNLKEFKKRFNQIRGKTFKTWRAGDDGGAGQTLEHLLGLKENNIAMPDLGNIELKVHLDRSRAPITLFTFDRDSWVMDQAKAIMQFGVFDSHGIQRLNSRLSVKPNIAGLYLGINEDSVYIAYRKGAILVAWEMDDIRARFEQKLPAMILVNATRGTDKYTFNQAILLRKPSIAGFKKHLLNGYIFIETRLGLKNGVVRNHGTSFRAYERNLKNLFVEQRLI